MELFSKRLDEIFDQGMPTKAQILDAFNKFASLTDESKGDADVLKLLKRAYDLVGNPCTNISSSCDMACDNWRKDYENYIEHSQSSPLPVSEEKTADVLDLQQYVTNLLYSALEQGYKLRHYAGIGEGFRNAFTEEFDKWVEKEIKNISEYYAAQFRSETNEIMDIDKGEKNYTRYGDQLMELWCKCGPTERYKDSIMQGIWYCGHCKKPIHEKD